jgi:pimeloyl-ACP methyl ester carboxylesterase
MRQPLVGAAAWPAWTPEGFEEYRTHFPTTPTRVAGVERATTECFVAEWNAGADGRGVRSLAASAHQTSVVLVRGFLGNYMPGNLDATARALRTLGFDAFIAKNGAGATIERNARRIAEHLRERGTRERLLFCGHSRGGVEALTLLAHHREIAARCDGVVGSQMPFGPSRVLGSILRGESRSTLSGPRRRAAELVQWLGLHLVGAASGGRELSGEEWTAAVTPLSMLTWPFPVLQVASWSVQPTAWLDSFHRRLSEIAPGNAHDGQFYLDEALWPRLPHVLLPRIDHAQPVVGGFGFDAPRFWITLLSTLLALPSHTGARQ